MEVGTPQSSTDPAAFLQLIGDQVTAQVFYLDVELRYRYVNDAHVRWLGARREELLGRPLRDLIGRRGMATVEGVLSGGSGVGASSGTVRLDPGGTLRAIEARFTAHHDDRGELIGFALCSRESAEGPAVDAPDSGRGGTEAGFRALIEHSLDIVLVHRERRFVYVNSTLLRLLGYESVDELLGQPVELIIPESIRSKVGAHHQRLNQHSRTEQHEGAMLRRDGSECPVEVVATRVTFEGKPAVLTVARDLSAQRELTAKMMQMDRMVTVGTLAAGVGHEINNPLTYVNTNVAFAIDELVEARRQVVAGGVRPELASISERLTTIEEGLREGLEGIQRIADVVADLKALSRVDDRIPVVMDIVPILRSAIRMARTELRHRATLVERHETVLPVLGIESRLGQVFLNLIVNAAQAIDTGSVEENQICVTTRLEAEKVVVGVRDTGVGIHSSRLERIFEPFVTSKPSAQGTGLGLAICREIVLAHGGTIHVESTVDVGSEFIVTLPVWRGPVDARQREPVGKRRRGARVLVVDDEALLCRALKRTIGRNHEVEAVTDARDALKRLASGERYDLILCDLMMPHMSGASFHAKLLDIDPQLASQVVFMTGGAFTPAAMAFVDTIDNLLLEKPLQEHRLAALIDARLACAVERTLRTRG